MQTTDKLLIAGGVAVVGFIAYQWYKNGSTGEILDNTSGAVQNVGEALSDVTKIIEKSTETVSIITTEISKIINTGLDQTNAALNVLTNPTDPGAQKIYADVNAAVLAKSPIFLNYVNPLGNKIQKLYNSLDKSLGGSLPGGIPAPTYRDIEDDSKVTTFVKTIQSSPQPSNFANAQGLSKPISSSSNSSQKTSRLPDTSKNQGIPKATTSGGAPQILVSKVNSFLKMY